MGRDAMSKLVEARELDKEADRLRKRDPVIAQRFDRLAHAKRESAARQMRRRPGKKGQKASKAVL